MIKTLIFGVALLVISGCSTLRPTPVDPYTMVEDSRSLFKEIGIIEELNASGCDIKRFETMTSARKNSITVNCK